MYQEQYRSMHDLPGTYYAKRVERALLKVIQSISVYSTWYELYGYYCHVSMTDILYIIII